MDRNKTATELLFGALNNAYRYYNYMLFNSELPNCILNFSRKSNTHGFFAPKRWGRRENTDFDTHEISLTPTTLYRSPIEIFSTLVHEMCHLWQWEFGTYSRNGYHNKEWANKMMEIGLMPSSTGKVGGSKTGQRVSHYIIEGGAYAKAFKEMPEDFVLPFRTLEGAMMQNLIDGLANPPTNPSATKKKKRITTKASSKTKYSCACGKNVWGKPRLRLRCLECGNDFKEV